MKLETQRLIIRPFFESDRCRMIELLTSDSYMEFSSKGALSENDANSRFEDLVSRSQGVLGKHALVYKEEDSVIGYCGFESFALNGTQAHELGYRMAVEWRGRGLATEACIALLNELSTTEFDKYALVEPINYNSTRVLEKIGFSKIGNHNYQGLDCLLYKLNEIK